MLKLSALKAGENAPKLKLNLTKGARFLVELFWDSSEDLDTHAFLATNSGSGAKVTRLEEVLSTYNLKKNDPANGVLVNNPDGKSFQLPCGSLHHSGDALTGDKSDIDEIITVDGSKIANGANEIPIVVTIHDPKNTGATFGRVKKAGIRIKNSGGAVLGEYELSSEFGSFNVVQMGSLILGANGWEFVAVGSGLNGDFGTVLGYFS